LIGVGREHGEKKKKQTKGGITGKFPFEKLKDRAEVNGGK